MRISSSGLGAFSLLRPRPIAVANDGFDRTQGADAELLCRAMFKRPRSWYRAPLAAAPEMEMLRTKQCCRRTRSLQTSGFCGDLPVFP
jgi:hypothetical protein